MSGTGRTGEDLVVVGRQKWIADVALKQAAVDLGCSVEDFSKNACVVVEGKGERKGRRKDLKGAYACHMISFGGNIVAAVEHEFEELVKEYISKYDPSYCFSSPFLNVLYDRFKPLGYGVGNMAEYWLPDLTLLKPLPCVYQTRVMNKTDFADLYTEEWSNALCADRSELDVLGVGAFDDEGKLVGLAACSMDGEDMWQIGIDVLPKYRRMGIASALTSQLAVEILKRDKVPFYCCAWCNIGSARNAQKSGFRLAWTDLRIQKQEEIDIINNI